MVIYIKIVHVMLKFESQAQLKVVSGVALPCMDRYFCTIPKSFQNIMYDG